MTILDINKKYYISGPMTGIENFNLDEFARVTGLVRSAGAKAVSPTEVAPVSEGATWEAYLRKDLIAMLWDCDALIMLKGWESSRGANLELHVAKVLGFDLFILDDDDNIVEFKDVEEDS